MADEFVIPAGDRSGRALESMIRFAQRLDRTKAWRWTLVAYKPRRSNSQNSYLWGVCYPKILQADGMDGWEADDLHEYFLGEHFGWETLTGLGRKRVKPIRRSSKLSTTEFMDFVGFIQRRMANEGVYIPDPDEPE